MAALSRLLGPIRALARRAGAGRVPQTVFAATAVALLLGSGLIALDLSPTTRDLLAGNRETVHTIESAADADGDGLPDAVENVVGSRVDRADTLGGGVPDGWIHHWFGSGIDWNDTSLLEAPALGPPADALPPPLREEGALRLPTVREVHAAEAARAAQAGFEGAWWLQMPSLDPLAWDADGDGIADAWLMQHGLDATAADADATAPGDGAFTLREKYMHGLDPTRVDSDGDGLGDREELDGVVVRGTERWTFEPTDPRRLSTRGDGIADGFLVRFSLDPHDRDVAGRTPAGDGVTVLEAFEATARACGPGCPWMQRLADGPLLDPTRTDSIGDGVPDVWSLRDPDGLLDPLLPADEVVLDTTDAWDASPWGGDVSRLEGVVVDELNPLPEPFSVTAADAYGYLRPATWDEAADGPWWNGLPPRNERGEGTLPPAVALRGWTVQADTGLGGEERPTPQESHADPRNADTDGDGRSDLEEYFGIRPDGTPGRRTAADDPDTDGDGLSDGQESDPTGLGTDALRRDTSGSFLTDGQEASYWQERYDEALRAFAEDPGKARLEYGWLDPAGSGVINISRLLPSGVLHGASTNILSADSDGDGILDGAELFPERFLPQAGRHARPSTDPARQDTDGDGLPDTWEVRWSQDRYFGCTLPCVISVPVLGWPIDPTAPKSVAVDDAEDDGEINLSDDDVRADHKEGGFRPFSNRLAYVYDLHPFEKDTDGDGLPDMFSIHWGIEQVPGDVRARIENEQASFQWIHDATARIGPGYRERAGEPMAGPAVIDPLSNADDAEVSLDTNLLGMFRDREKGVWVVEPGTDCGVQRLSGPNGPPPARRAAYDDIDRSGLAASCWVWVPHLLRHDLAGTDPWRHDFDGDGLPDAWERHYGVALSASPETIAAGSLAAGCNDPDRHEGLPEVSEPSEYCITLKEAFELGLDPRAQDTDGGGFPDWLELAIQENGEALLDPLDPDDDFGEEDWDGDGILNLEENLRGTSVLSPDTDGDGLADGGHLDVEGDARGDICIPATGDDVVPSTAHRKPEPLTWAGLHQLYVQAGILHDAGDDNGCPAGEVRFLAEGVVDPEDGFVKGSGQGTDPTLWDSCGDGVPDGWLVYWRSRSGSDSVRSALTPWPCGDPASQTDPDGDFLPTGAEYALGRPGDWREADHGPWWGGSDPGRPDTDDDEAWFANALDADDSVDSDLDNDGLGGTDPDPLSTTNVLAVRRTADGYETDHAALWTILEARRGSHLDDSRDDDRVPEFLDRAATRVDGLTVSDAEVSKGGTFQVAGRLLVDEERTLPTSSYLDLTQGDAAGDGAAVEGATVAVHLTDAAGRKAVVGVGFTGADGRFSITATLTPQLQVPPAPASGAVVAGRILPAGAQTTVETGAPGLEPGPTQLVVVVEANDPALQPVVFHDGGGHAKARAHKVMDDGRYTPPGGRPLRSVVLTEDGAAPLVPSPHIVHDADALFPALSAPREVRLLAPTEVVIDPPAERIRVGEPMPVAGRLLDADGAPLPGRSLTLKLVQGGTTAAQVTDATDASGRLRVTFDTADLEAGPTEVHASAVLLPDDDFLEKPSSAEETVPLAQDTQWTDVTVDGRPAGPGRSVPVQADGTTHLSARLVDHRGHAAAEGLVFSLRLSGDQGTVLTTGGQTTAGGNAEATFDVPEGLPRGVLTYHLEHGAVSPDQHTAHAGFMEPLFATRLEVRNATLDAGTAGHLEGVLLRADGTPVEDPEATFVATSDGGQVVQVTGTDEDGAFRVPVSSDIPRRQDWDVVFTGLRDLAPAAPAEATSWHMGHVEISLEQPHATRGAPMVIEGAVRAPPPARAAGTVHAEWNGMDIAGDVASDGTFRLATTAPQEEGTYTLTIAFSGSDILHPAQQTRDVRVRVPANLTVDGGDLLIRVDGTADAPLATGRLLDERGEPLSGRTVHLLLETVRASLSTELVTDAEGAIQLLAGDVPIPRPGAWAITATYPGNDRETPASAAAEAAVRQEVVVHIDSLPSTLRPGEPGRVAGHVSTAGDLAGIARVGVLVGPAHVGSAVLDADHAWSMRIRNAGLPPGEAQVTADADLGPDYVVTPATATITLVEPIEIAVTETPTADGGRIITLELSGGPDGGEGEIVVTRLDEDGRFLGRHVVATEDQRATVRLSAGETGEIRVASLRMAGAEVEAVHFFTQPEAASSDALLSVTTIVLGSVTLLLAAGLVVGLYLWRSSVGRGIGDAAALARRRLLDGSASPREVIKQAYHMFLDIMREAGYRPEESETVRHITRQATRTFRLPRRPMGDLSGLFESAVYSDEVMDETHRHRAIHAFGTLERIVGRGRGVAP